MLLDINCRLPLPPVAALSFPVPALPLSFSASQVQGVVVSYSQYSSRYCYFTDYPLSHYKAMLLARAGAVRSSFLRASPFVAVRGMSTSPTLRADIKTMTVFGVSFLGVTAWPPRQNGMMRVPAGCVLMLCVLCV